MVSWEFISCAIALGTMIVALHFYIKNLIWNSYRYLAEVYYEILKIEIKHPEFLDPEKTRKYKELWGPDSKELFRYEAYAQMCWSFLEDIYAPYTASFNKNNSIKLYAPTFERYNTLHGVWLRDNKSMMANSFIEFVESKKWEDCYPDDHNS
jgi:hypothetical protein